MQLTVSLYWGTFSDGLQHKTGLDSTSAWSGLAIVSHYSVSQQAPNRRKPGLKADGRPGQQRSGILTSP